jgi:transcriptional antiterminator RfaH
MPGPRWYVAQTKPQQSHIAIVNLERQGFECFSPVYLRRTREGDHKSPLFPGYLFVRFDQLESDDWKCIHSTIGVLRLLGQTGEKPSPVREAAMNEMLRLGGLVDDLTMLLPFAAGESVTFTEGPLKGMTGKALQVSTNRVTLLFSLLGTESMVYSSPAYLRSAAKQEPGLAVVR